MESRTGSCSLSRPAQALTTTNHKPPQLKLDDDGNFPSHPYPIGQTLPSGVSAASTMIPMTSSTILLSAHVTRDIAIDRGFVTWRWVVELVHLHHYCLRWWIKWAPSLTSVCTPPPYISMWILMPLFQRMGDIWSLLVRNYINNSHTFIIVLE